MIPDWLVAVFVVAFGLVFGSFGNVVVWRLPRGESLSYPPSTCPCCGHRIAWWDNVPVISWLILSGKCRACGGPISVRYPLVELASGGLWLVAWLQFGLSWRLPFAIGFYYLLLLLAAIDLDTSRLPNPLVILLAGVGIVGCVVAQFTGEAMAPLLGGNLVYGSAILTALTGAVVSALPALAIAEAYAKARGTQGLGMGDVKLLAAIGLFLGLYGVLVLFFGSMLGAVVGIAQASGERDAMRKQRPFGPFLALAAVAITLFGEQLWTWYAGIL